MEENNFSIGQTVRLKSGSPLMTVMSINGDYIKVIFWMDSTSEFHEQSLLKALLFATVK